MHLGNLRDEFARERHGSLRSAREDVVEHEFLRLEQVWSAPQNRRAVSVRNDTRLGLCFSLSLSLSVFLTRQRERASELAREVDEELREAETEAELLLQMVIDVRLRLQAQR